MPESLQPSIDLSSEHEPIIDWDSEHIRASYKGRLARVPYWKVAESDVHEPYVKDSLHRVADAEVSDEDGSISFLMAKLEENEATFNLEARMRVVSRTGPPEEIILQGEREIWVYGDRGVDDDQTLSFSLARNLPV